MVEDSEIQEMIEKELDSKETVTQLIELAKERGGNDNITVICIRFTQEG